MEYLEPFKDDELSVTISELLRGMQEPPPHWKLAPKDEYASAVWRQASPRTGQR